MKPFPLLFLCGILPLFAAPDSLLTSRDLVPPSPVAVKDVLFEETEFPFFSPIVNEHPMNRLFGSAMCTGGVAAGDVDGDGKPDLYFTGGPKENALFLQTGDFVFTKADCGLD